MAPAPKPYLFSPCYDKYPEAKQDLQDLLNSLRAGKYSNFFRVVILLDSCHRIFEHEFQVQFPEFEFWNHKVNPFNFCGNVNRGLRVAREEKVGALIVNQDCIMPHVSHFTGKLASSSMQCTRTVELPNLSLEEVVGRLNELSCSDEENVPVSKINGNKVAGYCFWLAPEVLQEVGLLPEHILKASFDDDHMTALCLLAGFPVELIPTTVYHKGSHIDQTKTGKSRTGAYSPNDGSLELHRIKFCEYWKIPNSVAPENYIKWILQNYEWTPELRQQVITE